MMFYSKVIAAIVGLLVVIGSRYGLDLEQSQQLIVDALTAIATAFSVYFVKNKPQTMNQVDTARDVINESAQDIRDKA